MDPTQLFHEAMTAHKKGELAKAEVLYQQIIQHDAESSIPNGSQVSFTALHLLGNLKAQQSQYNDALTLIERALQMNISAPQAYADKGNILRQLGRRDDALTSFELALAVNADFAPAQYYKACTLIELNRFGEALEVADGALARKSDFVECWHVRGLALEGLGEFDKALQSYDTALASHPRLVGSWQRRGHILLRQQKFTQALEDSDRALKHIPDDAAVLYARAVALAGLSRWDDAFGAYGNVLARHPRFVDAMIGQSTILGMSGRFEEAAAVCREVLAIDPRNVTALNNLGAALQALNRLPDALACYMRALQVVPHDIDMLNNRGNILRMLGRREDALASFSEALHHKHDDPETLNGLATTLYELGNYQLALKYCDMGIVLRPAFPDLLVLKGSILHGMGRFEDALYLYQHALSLAPNSTVALNAQGNTLRQLGMFPQALESYNAAHAISPADATTLYNRGMIFWTDLQDHLPAIADMERVVSINPDFAYARGDLLHWRMHCADWRHFDSEVERVRSGVRAGRNIINPFGFQAISNSPNEARRCAEIFAADRHRPVPTAFRFNRGKSGKLRVGYLSGEFREQATAYLAAGLYEMHDRQRFEIVALDNGKPDGSPMRKRLENAFDKFIDVSDLDGEEAARRIHEEGIDILVNLNGYFGASRMDIFSRRPAPLQVNYLGFPGTLGAPYIDYILADRRVIPESDRQYYSENVVYLPSCYQINDSKREARSVQDRSAHGLPDGAFIFCNFNQSYKFTPKMFDVWMGILREVKGSFFWLLDSNPVARINLKREAERAGIAGDRLIFAEFVAVEQHLARLGLADLCLDSLPYNAHTTGSDSLWAGVPLLTCEGAAFPGRVAASILSAVGLPELITKSLDEYKSAAIRLAKDPSLLQAHRLKLAPASLGMSLFNTELSARQVEAAYTKMWQLYESGKAPCGFDVD